MSRKRLVVVPWLEGGGAQKALIGILRGVQIDSIEVVVIFKGNRNYSELQELGFPVSFLSYDRDVFGTIKAAWRLRRLVRRVDGIYSLARGSHVVLGLLDCFSPIKCEVAASIHQMPWVDNAGLTGRVESIFQSRLLRKSVMVVSPSKAALDHLVAHGSISSLSAHVEMNSLKLNSVGAVAAKFGSGDVLRLAFCGRLTEQKGVDQLLRCMSLVSRQVWLRIAGDGPEIELLRSIAAGLPSRHRVEFLGHIDPIEPLLDWSHAVILPSRSELQPVAVWESWSRGRVVIGSDILAYRDLQSLGPLIIFKTVTQLKDIIEAATSESSLYSDAFESALRAARSYRSGSGVSSFLSGVCDEEQL